MSKILNKIDIRLFSIVAISMVMFFLVGIVAANSYYTFKNFIYNGVNVAGIQLGGLTKEEAKVKLDYEIDKIYSQPVLKLQYKDQSWDVKQEDIDFQIDKEALLDKAYKVGREGTLVEKTQAILYSIQKGHNIDLIVTYDKDKTKSIVANISKVLDKSPVNAKLKIVDNKPTIEPETNGLKVRQLETNELIEINIKQILPAKVDLPVDVAKAEVLTTDLNDITDLLSTYSTNFNSYLVYRSNNVDLASKYVNGALLKPGEVFSFDQRVGSRSAERGFKNAPVFEGDEVIDGIGGGICQVSSTLYLAALYANLEIVERSNHFRPVGYVPIGQDATIAEGIIDLKFKNSTSKNIYISSQVEGNTITIQIFGKKNADFPTSIKVVSDNIGAIQPKTVIKKDKEIPLGKTVVDKEGEQGYTASTYRLKYKGDALIEQEHLYDDYYPVVDKVIKEGTNKDKSADSKK